MVLGGLGNSAGGEKVDGLEILKLFPNQQVHWQEDGANTYTCFAVSLATDEPNSKLCSETSVCDPPRQGLCLQ